VDNGPGVPARFSAAIFRSIFYYQAAGRGTGLGLATCWGLCATRGNGQFSAPKGRHAFSGGASRGGHGETTNLRRPPRFSGARQRRAGPKTASLAKSRSPRVAGLEDEPTVGGLIADVLRDEGMRVDVRADGESRSTGGSRRIRPGDLRPRDAGNGRAEIFSVARDAQESVQGRCCFVTGDVVTPRTQNFLERHGLPYGGEPFRVEELRPVPFAACANRGLNHRSNTTGHEHLRLNQRRATPCDRNRH